MGVEFQILLKTLADLTGVSQTDEGLQKIAQQALNVAASAGQAGAETGRFVDAAGKLQGASGQFVATGQSAQEAGKHIGEASHEADHFVESLKAGLGIDIAHHVVEGLAEIPRAFQEALAEGVRFNAEMETLGIQLGGALRSANPGKYLNFSEARAAGEETLEKLRVKANELGTNFQALAETFAINAPLLAHAGIQGIEDQLNTIILLNQVAQAHGISGFQAQRDIIDILNGNGSRTQLGRELESNGVTNESIKQAEQMGTLMDLLNTKLGAYGEAGRAASDTFTASQQRLRNETEQLYGEISKPVFDELKTAYDTLAAEIVKPEVAQALQGLGIAVAGVVDVGSGLVNFAVQNAGVLVPLGTAIGAVTFALAAYKTAQIASIIGGRLTALVAETEATGAQAIAVTEQTAAIEANTAAKTANAGAGGVGVGGGIAAGATALVGGYLAGSALRASADKAADEDREQTGNDLNRDVDKTVGLQKDVRNAATVEEQLKKRQELTDHLVDAQKRLADEEAAVKKTRDDYVEGDLFVSEEQLARIENLKATIQSIKATIDQVNRTSVGDAADAAAQRTADKLAQSDAAAQARYDASPEGRLAKAEADGDQQGIDDAKYDAAVAKRAPKLEKEYGFSPNAAEQTAQAQESAADQKKQDDDDAKQQKREDDENRRTYEASQKKLDAEREQAAADAKRRADAIASINDQIAINRALAQGDTAGAAALEKKRDIQREIVELMAKGLSYQEASAKATEDVETANAAQDRKDADRASTRAARRRGDDGPDRTTYGFRDGDPAGTKLHTETLDGGKSVDRFAGTPDAAATALNKPTGAAAELSGKPTGDPNISANAKDHVPDVTPATPLSQPLSDLFAGDPLLASMFGGSSLASASLAPATAALGPLQGPGNLNWQAPGDSVVGSTAGNALSGLAGSANNTKGAADGVSQDAQALGQALDSLGSTLAELNFPDLTSRIQDLENTVSDLLANG